MFKRSCTEFRWGFFLFFIEFFFFFLHRLAGGGERWWLTLLGVGLICRSLFVCVCVIGGRGVAHLWAVLHWRRPFFLRYSFFMPRDEWRRQSERRRIAHRPVDGSNGRKSFFFFTTIFFSLLFWWTPGRLSISLAESRNWSSPSRAITNQWRRRGKKQRFLFKKDWGDRPTTAPSQCGGATIRYANEMDGSSFRDVCHRNDSVMTADHDDISPYFFFHFLIFFLLLFFLGWKNRNDWWMRSMQRRLMVVFSSTITTDIVLFFLFFFFLFFFFFLVGTRHSMANVVPEFFFNSFWKSIPFWSISFFFD